MMGSSYGNMMGSGVGIFGTLGLVFSIIIFIDAVLLGIWLWQQIQRGKK